MKNRNLYSTSAFVTPYGRTALIRGEILAFGAMDIRPKKMSVKPHEIYAELEMTYPILDVVERVVPTFTDKGYKWIDSDLLDDLDAVVTVDERCSCTDTMELKEWIEKTRAGLSDGMPVLMYRG